jgi:hypothetical protein
MTNTYRSWVWWQMLVIPAAPWRLRMVSVNQPGLQSETLSQTKTNQKITSVTTDSEIIMH